jgi:methionine aminopeptidase
VPGHHAHALEVGIHGRPPQAPLDPHVQHLKTGALEVFTGPDIGTDGKELLAKDVKAGNVKTVQGGMLTLGTTRTRILDDEWTVVTTDGSRAAHWEHTVAVTDDGPRVLTL